MCLPYEPEGCYGRASWRCGYPPRGFGRVTNDQGVVHYTYFGVTFRRWVCSQYKHKIKVLRRTVETEWIVKGFHCQRMNIQCTTIGTCIAEYGAVLRS
jgi:hypothetical protein